MQTKSCISFVARATASLFLLLSAYPTMADVRCQDQCTEATETHLPVYLWQDAARRPKGIVLLLHGIGERAYSLNYLAQQLVSGGFVVYGLDERGHGWWHFHQKKGDPGYSCDFIRTVKDVDRLLSLLRKQHPSIPVFLVGESVGAAVAWRAAIDTPDAVDGIVLAGTGCRLKYANVSWIMSDILRNCWRWNHQINIVRYQRRYGSDDLPAFDEILKDREQRKTLTLNEVMGARRFLQKNCKFARQLEPHIPVLVIQGANDKILSAESAEKVFDATSASDKRYILVPECGHVLLGISRLKSIVNDSIITFLNEMTFRHAVATSEEMFDQHLVDQSYLVDEPNSDLHKAQFDRH